ncbi:MAG TPA: MBL fold metallo-hydrolase [Acidimicrobiales bacterium]|nr:MBL fold metallo-hydrolase [Acidimicrobiales bacterium]
MARISGITDLLQHRDVPVHVQGNELSWLSERTGIDSNAVITHTSGDTILVGGLELVLIHTPGHTEGSQCVLFEGNLITGDTLFLDGCGRTDLPGGDAGELFESLTVRLAGIPDTVPVYPGHAYSPLSSESMGDIRRHNPVLAPLDREQWLARFSH